MYILIHISASSCIYCLDMDSGEKKKTCMNFMVWSRMGGKGVCIFGKYLHW